MYSRETIIINKSGLHARPASDLTLKAKEFASEIKIVNLDKEPWEINIKSILKVLAAAIPMGAHVEIRAEGDDEKEAVDALVQLIEAGFGE